MPKKISHPLYFKTIGHKDPHIVMLHGWGFHSDVMQPLIENLAIDHTVTVLDLPGFGRSKNFESDFQLENIIKTILKVSPRKAVYLGWSLGGLLAMQIALRYPTRVKKLITIASNPFFIAQANWPGIDPEIFAEFVDGVIRDTEMTLRKFALLVVQGGFRYSAIYQKLKQQLFIHGKPSLAGLLGGLEILQKTDLREHINAISCPKKFIFAEKDHLVPVDVAEKIKLISPDVKMAVIPDASHSPFLFKLVETVSEIRSFIS